MRLYFSRNWEYGEVATGITSVTTIKGCRGFDCTCTKSAVEKQMHLLIYYAR